MDKMEALVDTVFLQNLSSRGKRLEDFKKIINELNYRPVIHPYIAEHELDVFTGLKVLEKEGFVRMAKYEDFLHSNDDKDIYADYFQQSHEELRKKLEHSRKRKRIDPLVLPAGVSIFEFHRAGMSLGDVHLILMAAFEGIPVVLSDDSDIELLKGIAKKYSYSQHEIEIMGSVEVLEKIASMAEPHFTKDELVAIVKNAGKAKEKSRVKQAWNKVHGETT